MVTDPEPKSIVEAAKSCREAFQQRFLSLQNTDSNDCALVEDQNGRFSIWCSNIGVFSPGCASMDYRLRNAEDIQDLVMRMLDTLRSHIEQVGGQNDAQTEWTGAVDQRSSLTANRDDYLTGIVHKMEHNQSLSAVARDITLLHKLSNTIRKASIESSNEKAAETFPLIDEDGNDISATFRDNYASILIEHRFPEASSSIRERLADAMLLRRRRFAYRKHRYQNNPFRLPQLSDPTQSFSQLKPAPKSLARPGTTLGNLSRPPAQSYPKSLSQAPTATTLDIERYRKISAPSRVSIVRTMAIHHDIQSDFPSLPKFQESEDPVCPYCFLVLLNGETKSVQTWNEHVKTDLDAYVCLFEDCETPDTLFVHSKDWLNHMKQSHRMEWRCSSKSHEPVVFQTRTEYEEHMKYKHKGTISQKQLALLAERSLRPIQPLFSSCPLCGAEEADIGMENHIASHLRYLALKCLPWSDDVGEATLSDMNSGTVETRSTLAQTSGRRTTSLASREASPHSVADPVILAHATYTSDRFWVDIDDLYSHSRGRRYMRYSLMRNKYISSDRIEVFERPDSDSTLRQSLKNKKKYSGSSKPLIITQIINALNARETGGARWRCVFLQTTTSGDATSEEHELIVKRHNHFSADLSDSSESDTLPILNRSSSRVESEEFVHPTRPGEIIGDDSAESVAQSSSERGRREGRSHDNQYLIPKTVEFKPLLHDQPKTWHLRVLVYPYDQLESITTTVKSYFGIADDVSLSFEDEDGNSVVVSYETLEHGTTVYIRVVPGIHNYERQREFLGKRPHTLLARACDNNDLESVKAQLARRPQDLNVADHAENTPLHIAASKGYYDIVKYLLEANGEVNTFNKNQATPLIDAVENGHVKVVRLLLDHAAHPRLRNAVGNEPLELVPQGEPEYGKISAMLVEAIRLREIETEASFVGAKRSTTQPDYSVSDKSKLSSDDHKVQSTQAPNPSPIYHLGQEICHAGKRWKVHHVRTNNPGGTPEVWEYEVVAVDADENGFIQSRILVQDADSTGITIVEELIEDDLLKSGADQQSGQQEQHPESLSLLPPVPDLIYCTSCMGYWRYGPEDLLRCPECGNEGNRV